MTKQVRPVGNMEMVVRQMESVQVALTAGVDALHTAERLLRAFIAATKSEIKEVKK